METKKIILLHNITPCELKKMIVLDLKIEIEKLLFNANKPTNYSVQEAALLLKISKLTIYNYIKKGKLNATKIGRKYLISAKDLDKVQQRVKSLNYRR